MNKVWKVVTTVWLFIIAALMFNFSTIIYSLSLDTNGTINIIKANVLYFTQSWDDTSG